MTFWDFVSEGFFVVGEWLSDHMAVLLIVVGALIVIGLLKSEWKSTPLDEPTAEQTDARKAWVMRGKMPPSLFPAWYKAEDEAEMIADACMAEYEGFDNPS